jgi:hypothetical protein
MVQRGHHVPLDCIYDLSSGWKGRCIQLFAGFKQRRVQGFWKRIAIISDGTYSFTLNIRVKFVVHIAGFRTALTRSMCKIPSASIEYLRRRRMAQHWKSGDNSRYVSKVVCATISCMLSVWLCIIYHAVRQTTSKTAEKYEKLITVAACYASRITYCRTSD